MADLIDQDQVDQIRRTMFDIGDTFAFPVTIIKTSYANGAFATDPTIDQEIETVAVREFRSGGNETDQFRNELGPEESHIYDLYIGWDKVLANDLIDADKKVLLDHNDLVRMEGKIYRILAFGGIGDMTKEPVFLQLTVEYRWQNPNGGNDV